MGTKEAFISAGTLVTRSIIALAFGIILFPKSTNLAAGSTTFATIVALFVLANGILAGFVSASFSHLKKTSMFRVIFSFLCALMAAYLLLKPDISASGFSLLMFAYLITAGALDISGGILLPEKRAVAGKFHLIIAGTLSVGIGVYYGLIPLGLVAKFSVTLLAIYLVFAGLFYLLTAISYLYKDQMNPSI